MTAPHEPSNRLDGLEPSTAEDSPSGPSSARPRGEVTRLLNGWAAGDERSRDRLFELVHPEIRAIALRQRRGYGASATLQATEIVHEAFLKLVDQPQAGWDHRAQFFKLASSVLRQVLVDH
ncbi:MAG: ECF-type sigma factor, partial [Acidobacteriota bacterium]